MTSSASPFTTLWCDGCFFIIIFFYYHTYTAVDFCKDSSQAKSGSILVCSHMLHMQHKIRMITDSFIKTASSSRLSAFDYRRITSLGFECRTWRLLCPVCGTVKKVAWICSQSQTMIMESNPSNSGRFNKSLSIISFFGWAWDLYWTSAASGEKSWQETGHFLSI